MTDNTLDHRETQPQATAVAAEPARNRTGLWLLVLLAAILAIWYLLSQRAPAPTALPDASIAPIPTQTTPADGSDAASGARKPVASAAKPKPTKPALTTPRETAPERIANRSPEPEYPATALRRGEGGDVLLRVNVGADGVPGEVDFVRRSSSRELDRAAQDAVKRWRFEPATRNGKPIPAVVEVPIEFKPQA
ncbi:TonB family protein [Lysobacter sp. 5GHs7-4]|uniref:energy transducer TonB n=1 Tax=Lysobacter sp. 5GHs7-4 TaxID=2904253 RepID=UPI001E4061E1|nr:energy transducer TonB [Lysobacter sp. 5GHs7-4]UHQ21266.1 TonB family protein [Lysobacter sp. 5GHs7-4]